MEHKFPKHYRQMFMVNLYETRNVQQNSNSPK